VGLGTLEVLAGNAKSIQEKLGFPLQVKAVCSRTVHQKALPEFTETIFRTTDWHDVVSKLNPRFVFVQAYHMGREEASSYANPRFANYRRALQRLGLLHGAYLRCHPNANAETLIKKFWTVYTPQVGDILPTLDIEEDYDNRCSLPVQKRINQIEKMIQLVSTRINGYKPMIYTKARVWSELGNPAQFADCPLWVVDYHSTGEPTLPPTWSRFSFWQYAENLHGNGVQGTYDSDYFNGSEGDLRAYLLQK